MTTNHLRGASCPNCAADAHFFVTAQCEALVGDGHIQCATDFRWTPQSPVTCSECLHQAPLRLFADTSTGHPTPAKVPRRRATLRKPGR